MFPNRTRITRRLAIVSLLLLALLPSGLTAADAGRPVDPAQDYQLIGIIGQHLASFDQATGQATDLGTLYGYSNFLAGTTGPNNTLYFIADAFGATTPKLVRIDPWTLQVTLVRAITLPGETVTRAESLAFNPANGLFYAAVGQSLSNILITIHPQTGAITRLSTISGTPDEEADVMEWVGDTLYIIDVGNDAQSRLYTVNPATGVATLVGDIGIEYVDELAFDPESQLLYGNAWARRELLRISRVTGHGTVVGPTHTPDEFEGGYTVALTFYLPPQHSVLYIPLVCNRASSSSPGR